MDLWIGFLFGALAVWGLRPWLDLLRDRDANEGDDMTEDDYQAERTLTDSDLHAIREAIWFEGDAPNPARVLADLHAAR